MTFAPKRPCRHPGCRELVASGYCAAHQRNAAPRAVARVRDRARGTAAERGYDARWRLASRGFLARFPLCPGVLIPTALWTQELAEQFHALRERAHERGEILYLTERPAGVAAAAGSCLAFLEEHLIYRVEPWDLSRAAVVVDHIIPHKGDMDLFWSEWNWQPLTKRAHDKKTAAEDRGAWGPGNVSDGQRAGSFLQEIPGEVRAVVTKLKVND